MRTTTERPFSKFSTFTFVPKGSERCAAVKAPGLHLSPEAVRDVNAYQEARPVSALALPVKCCKRNATQGAAQQAS